MFNTTTTEACSDPLITSESGGQVLFAVMGGIMFLGLLVLFILVRVRSKVQPLRLKSASLLSVVIGANTAIILAGTIMQIGTEECAAETKCAGTVWANITIWLGIIVLSFLEPLAICAQLMRSLRLRKIFDA
jgi:heme/copper-type cytochrome/quinol oxidase subunit 3